METQAHSILRIGPISAARRLCLRFIAFAPIATSLAAGGAAWGDIELRSFAGQPLDVRVAIHADRNAWIDLACIGARAGDRELAPLPSSRFRLDESLDQRTLVVRSHDAFAGPYVTLELTLRCDSKAPVVRTYDLDLPLLDAPVILVQKTSGSAEKASAQSSPLTSGGGSIAPTVKRGSTWTTRSEDTLQSIAKGLYPKSARMRAAFLQRLREANPGLLAKDGELLAAGQKLILPDLVALANESPRIDAQYGKPAAPPVAKVATSKVPAQAGPSAPARAAKSLPVREAPPTAHTAAPQGSTASMKERASSSVFTLRLSGAEMDLSRSKGVSEATRAAIRDKQLMLDADDQVAALLALRHTVKQLEGRLNEMQLQLLTTTLAPPSAKVAPASKPAAPAVAEVAPQKHAPQASAPTQTPPVAQAESPPAGTEQPSTAAAPAAPSKAQSAKPAAAQKPAPATLADATGSEAPFWQSPIFLGIAGLLALVLGWVGWRWVKRDREAQPASPEAGKPVASSHEYSHESATSDLRGPASDRLPIDDWDDDPPARAKPIRSGPPSANLQSALRDAEHHETVRMRAPPPDLLDAAAASLELDTRPSTSVDFVLGDEGGEDKSRRQRYMEERFPELAHHSISVDEPDSIIDAARHHYEEGQLQKAIELLTYAFEERPGQLRFWLALFEIHRLEQRIDDFAELAARFKNVHGGTDAWPMVQHIGRDLDPGQPLYSAALGRLGVPMDTDFDPMSENWLNVPMDFTSDVLMIELRHSLMAEHVVLDDELRRPLIEVQA